MLRAGVTQIPLTGQGSNKPKLDLTYSTPQPRQHEQTNGMPKGIFDSLDNPGAHHPRHHRYSVPNCVLNLFRPLKNPGKTGVFNGEEGTRLETFVTGVAENADALAALAAIAISPDGNKGNVS